MLQRVCTKQANVHIVDFRCSRHPCCQKGSTLYRALMASCSELHSRRNCSEDLACHKEPVSFCEKTWVVIKVKPVYLRSEKTGVKRISGRPCTGLV